MDEIPDDPEERLCLARTLLADMGLRADEMDDDQVRGFMNDTACVRLPMEAWVDYPEFEVIAARDISAGERIAVMDNDRDSRHCAIYGVSLVREPTTEERERWGCKVEKWGPSPLMAAYRAWSLKRGIMEVLTRHPW